MDANARIQSLMNARKWSAYKLAKESGLSQSTIANLFTRNTVPSITTLESICTGLGISLAQFFCEGSMVELADEQKEMFDRWVLLTSAQKKVLFELIETMYLQNND